MPSIVGPHMVLPFVTFTGHYNKSALPHCWYTWLVLCLIPVMSIAGMVVQFCKTAKDRDHREGKNGSPGRQTHRWTDVVITSQADTVRQTDTHTDRQIDRQMDRQTDSQTDTHTDRQTDRWADRQSDRWTDRHTHRQTDTHTERQTDSN